MLKRKCPLCKKFFETSLKYVNLYKKTNSKLFCSKKCSYKYRIKKFYIKVKCKKCGKPLLKRKKEVKTNIFCSRSCSGKYNTKYLNGKKHPNYKGLNSEYRKTALREFPNNCYFCSYNNVKILEVHHIDKNRQNNSLSNLVIVCPTHHKELHKGIIKYEFRQVDGQRET